MLKYKQQVQLFRRKCSWIQFVPSIMNVNQTKQVPIPSMIIIGCFIVCSIQCLLSRISGEDSEEYCSSQTHHNMKSYLILLFSLDFISLSCLAQILPITNDTNRIRTYIVFLENLPGTNLLSDEHLESWHKSFLPNTTLDSGERRLIYSYREAMSGFAAKLTCNEATSMSSIAGFLQAQPERSWSQRTTFTPKFLGLSEFDGLWPDSYYGSGIVIGIIDTGVLPTHVSFDDTDMPPPPRNWNGSCDFSPHLCNKKVIGAKMFVGGRIKPAKADDIGHGTNVASIAAGNFVDGAQVLGQAKGRASGMAPKAHLAIYKAQAKSVASYQESDLIACIDNAILDGVDIISMSIGPKPLPLHENPINVVTFSAIKNGIFVSVSAGNSGPYKSTVEDDAPWLMTVGASSTNRRIRTIARLGNGTDLIGESGIQPKAFNSTTLEIVYPGRKGLNNGKYCMEDSFKNIDVRGKAVLCVFGKITFAKKSENVKREGGAAMIIINYSWYGSTTFSDATVVPTVHLNGTGSKILYDYQNFATNYTPTVTFIFKGTIFDDYPAPRVASFSSRGPSLENGGILKPDIVAPGEGILCASPFEISLNGSIPSNSSFDFATGTSMSAPHIAGIAALIKKNHRDWSPAAIKSAIMTTARTVDGDQNQITDESTGKKADYFAMGSGQVHPVDANDPGLIYDINPSEYVAYLCGLGYTDAEVTKFTRNKTDCSKIQEIEPEQLNYPSMSVSLDSSSTKTIGRTVTNVGDEDSVYTFDIDEPEGVKMTVVPDKLQFKSKGEKLGFNVTFSVKGSFPTKDKVSEGRLSLDSRKYYVTSPVVVTFI